MRVLWLSNRVQSSEAANSSGTWLESTRARLLAAPGVELGNIAFGNVDSVQRQDCLHMAQWAVPARLAATSRARGGLPPKRDLDAILGAIDYFQPDVVHVWGVETFWGLLTAKGLIKCNVLLEMQGLKSAVASVYLGGLSLSEQWSCVGIKEVVTRQTLWHRQRAFAEWAPFERDIVRAHRWISAQSDWVEAHLRAFGATGRIFRNDLILRDEFYTRPQWCFSGRPVIFCSAAYSAPFKGLHVAIRALAYLKRRFPGVQLRIAGAHPRFGVGRDGYVALLQREARRLGVQDNIQWLGSLNASRIADELHTCSAMVIPSFVESYCLALAEAMALGVPCVTSFTGGTAHLARHEESALFFVPGDHVMCAMQLERVLGDKTRSQRLSHEARALAITRSDPHTILRTQLNMYEQVRGTGGEA